MTQFFHSKNEYRSLFHWPNVSGALVSSKHLKLLLIVFITLLSRDILAEELVLQGVSTHERSVQETARKKTDARKISWTPSDIGIIKSISLRSLSPPPASPSNTAISHSDAKKLGARLFFDTELSSNNQVSCATCHRPDLNFTDGKTLSEGIGTLRRNAPSLLGAGYQTWFYADGRRDSLWAQAITPLESMEEMGNTRTGVVRYVLGHSDYSAWYKTVFGEPNFPPKQLPKQAGPYGDAIAKKTWRYLSPNLKHQINQVFANIGRALAAYEQDLIPTEGKLEIFAEQLKQDLSVNHALEDNESSLSSREQNGLKLFIDNEKTQCLKCHNGPLLSNGDFHNIGTAKLTGLNMDLGRMIGLQAVFADEFNCYGRYSGVRQDACKTLRYVNKKDSHSPSLGAYKVPTLRGVSKTAPYGHDGSFKTLEDFLKHYREPPDKNVYQHELIPLDLSDREIADLAAFLKIL